MHRNLPQGVTCGCIFFKYLQFPAVSKLNKRLKSLVAIRGAES